MLSWGNHKWNILIRRMPKPVWLSDSSIQYTKQNLSHFLTVHILSNVFYKCEVIPAENDFRMSYFLLWLTKCLEVRHTEPERNGQVRQNFKKRVPKITSQPCSNFFSDDRYKASSEEKKMYFFSPFHLNRPLCQNHIYIQVVDFARRLSIWTFTFMELLLLKINQ